MISKKTTFIVVIIVISLVVGGLIGFYFYSKEKSKLPAFLGKDITKINFGTNNPTVKRTSSDGIPVEISTSTPNNTTTKEKAEPRLRKISTEPISGSDFVFINIYSTSTNPLNKLNEPADGKPAPKPVQPKIIGKKENIHFTDRATGHIFETSTSTKENLRISNTTVAKVYESFFVEGYNSVIYRDLVGNTDVIRTRYGSLELSTTTSEEKTLKLTDLPINSTQVAVSPSKDRMFLLMDDNGVKGYVSRVNGANRVSVFESPLKEWLVAWPSANNIILTTKASSFSSGFAYSLNPDTKSITRLLGNISGLTTLVSPDASKILFSQSYKGSLRTYVYDRKSDSYTELVNKTLAEKCVWSKVNKDVVYCAAPENIAFNTYPDVWYQGLITFSDNIWRINTKTGELRFVINLQKESGEVIDVINPQLDSVEDYMIFTNKSDLNLWGLRLVEPKKDTTLVIPTSSATTSTSTIKSTATSTASSTKSKIK